MPDRSVALTGATGFLGWHIAEAFRARGWRVRAILRPGTSKPLPDAVEPIVAPLEQTALTAAFEGCDAVVHAAAVTRAPTEQAFTKSNVEGTRAVVAAANAAAAPLLFISSLGAAGPGTPRDPAREDAAPRPVIPYGRSKLAGEAIVRSSAVVPWTILRPSAVYGPRDRNMLPLFRLAARGQLWLAARPGAAFTLTYADDVARAVVLAAEDRRAIGQTMFVGHPEPHGEDAILRALARVFGRSGTPRRAPRLALSLLGRYGDLLWRLGRQPLLDRDRLTELQADGWVCACDRAKDLIGFTASTPLDDGLARTRRWYEENGWI